MKGRLLNTVLARRVLLAVLATTASIGAAVTATRDSDPKGPSGFV